VDVLLVVGNDQIEICTIEAELDSKFKLKDLGVLKYFLGIEISQTKEGIYMSQKKYALDIIHDAGLQSYSTRIVLISTDYKDDECNPFLTYLTQHRQLVGCLNYLIIIKPNLTYVVGHFNQFM
jgi:hypothetical protein